MSISWRPGLGIAVELLELQSAVRRPEGYVHGAFKVGMFVENLEDFTSSLPESFEQPETVDDERNGLLMIQLCDPENNIVQIMQRKQ